MWDRSNMLIHLDLDYQNIDQRDEPYRHPSEMFTKLEPIYRATTSVLHRLGLPLLALITGRGYHFTGRVPLDSDAAERLAIAPETPHGSHPGGPTARMDGRRMSSMQAKA
jgi:hypothetical protein